MAEGTVMNFQNGEQMKRFVLAAAVVITTVLVGVTVDGTSIKAGTPVPADAKLVVQLTLTHARANDGTPCIEPSLAVTNAGAETLLVQKPTNRQAVVFFVTDEMGNVVAPQLRGKSDPAFEEQELRPGTEMKHTFENLGFVTGSAWMGYDLKTGGTYRVVALYRPSGKSGPGFCSNEETLVLN